MSGPRTEYTTVSNTHTPRMFMCACGRPLGDVEYVDGRSRLMYYNGRVTQTFYHGMIKCPVCGGERKFYSCRKEE